MTAEPGTVAGTASPAWPTLAGTDGAAGTNYVVYRGASCSAGQAALYTTSTVAGVTSGWTNAKYPAAV